jgi:polysaccharide transporter, PST family
MKKDALALYVIQGCNYLIPLVVLPLLSRTLGPERFGQVGFAQAFVQFFVMVTDFGFDLTAARAVSLDRDDAQAVARIYWTVSAAKTCLALACAGFIGLLLLLVPAFSADRAVIAIAMLTLLGTVINPVWLFQGLGRMPLIAVISIVARVLCLIPLFIFVHGPDDYLNAALALSIPMLLSGVCLSAIAMTTGLVKSWQPVTRALLYERASEAFHVFCGSALTFVYTYANAVILKFMAGDVAVGYYVCAEKLINPLKQMLAPLLQAAFPRICQMYAEHRAQSADEIVRKIVLGLLVCSALGVLVVFAFGEPLIRQIFGAAYLPALPVLKVLIFLPPVIGLAMIFIQLRLIAQGELRSLKKIYGIGAVFHIVQSFFLVSAFGATGTAVSVVLTELLVTVLTWQECRQVINRRRFAPTATEAGS